MEARFETEREREVPRRGDGEDQWTLPPFPPQLVRAAEVVWSDVVDGTAADRERLFTELSTYAYDLRRAGVPRDRVVAAVWPLFIGAATSHVLDDALERCMSAYDIAPD